MVRGRRLRAVQPSIKQPTKMTKTRATSKTCNALNNKTPMQTSTNDCNTNLTKSIETITQRTRNLRRSLHKIQKQFDNQAITKFFQRKLKTNIINTEIDVDNDENACDAFTTDIDDKSDIDIDSETVKVQAFSSFNFNHDNIINHQRFDGDNVDDDDQNSNGSGQSNSSSHNSIQSTNIFLQKPVLHLDIDKSTLNQVASIVINKNLEKRSNFANTFSGFDGCNINTANLGDDSPTEYDQLPADDESPSSQQSIDSPRKKCEKPKLRKLMPRKCANRIYSDSGLSDALNNSDSNSCDSGVVSDRSFELNSDANKPTTPHRIVCPTSTTPTAGVTTPLKPQAKLCTPNASTAIKMTAIRRNKARSARNVNPLNSAKSYFTKLVKSEVKMDGIGEVNVTVQTEEETKTDEDDSEMSSLSDSVQPKIGTNKIVKEIKCQPMSRSSTPLQLKPMQSKQMTDFFPVRRSIRKTKRAVEQEYLRHIEKAIEYQQEDGLVVKCFKDKGRGICAGRPFARGEFVVEYIGDLIEQNEADRREEIYAKDTAFGCYMYYFKHKEQQWCIDATSESGKLGRLVNHSRNGNLVTKIVTYKNRPHLVLVAKYNIKEGEELTYDYGDRTRESLINHPWLAL